MGYVWLIKYIMAANCIGGGKHSNQESNDLLHVTDKLYHMQLYQVLTALVVIGTESNNGRRKSNYHMVVALATLYTSELFIS